MEIGCVAHATTTILRGVRHVTSVPGRGKMGTPSTKINSSNNGDPDNNLEIGCALQVGATRTTSHGGPSVTVARLPNRTMQMNRQIKSLTESSG